MKADFKSLVKSLHGDVEPLLCSVQMFKKYFLQSYATLPEKEGKFSTLPGP
jgi:hypothetical protein